MRMRITRVLGTAAASVALAAGLAATPTASAAPAASAASAAGRAGAVSSHPVIAYIVLTGYQGSVLPVNTYNGAMLKRIRVGINSVAEVISPNGLYAYVANEGPPASVSVISTRTSKVVKTIPVSLRQGNGAFIGITPNGKMVYVSFGLGIVPIVTTDNKALTPVFSAAVTGMLLTPDSKTLYVNGVVSISTATGKVGKRLNVKSGGGAAFSPDGKTMYVAGGKTITPVNVATGKVGTPIEVPAAPRLSGIVISPDGRTAWVGILPSATVTNGVIPVDLVTRKAAPIIHEAGVPNWMLLTPDGKTLYIVHQAYSTMTAIQVATGTVLPTIHIGEATKEAVMGPEGKTIYLLTAADGIWRVYTATNKATFAIVPDGAQGVAIGFFRQ